MWHIIGIAIISSTVIIFNTLILVTIKHKNMIIVVPLKIQILKYPCILGIIIIY